jgi:hypothetical protein
MQLDVSRMDFFVHPAAQKLSGLNPFVKENRRAGTGSRLIALTEAVAASLRYRRIELDTVLTEAAPWWKARGYHINDDNSGYKILDHTTKH